MTAVAVARRFIEAINRHDLEAMMALMTEDHRLIDSGGVTLAGRDSVVDVWKAYFTMVPDYRIGLSESFEREDTAVVLGQASGSYVDQDRRHHGSWETPAAWRAVTAAGRVVEWQVFADNEPVRALMWQAGRAPAE